MVVEPLYAIVDGSDEPADVADTPSGAIGPRLTPTEAAGLPAKLRWSLVGWYRATGAFAEAAALLGAIEEQGGETAQLLDERARLALAEGRVAEARAVMEARVERFPAATARATLARVLLEAVDVAGAAAIGAELAREHPELVTVGALVADLARATGDLATARDYYEGVLAEKADNVGALLALARIAVGGGERRQAVGLLDAALDAAAEAATPAQLTSAAAIAELCDQPVRAGVLRARAVRLDLERSTALGATIDLALGRVGAGGAGAAKGALAIGRRDGVAPVRQRDPIGGMRSAGGRSEPEPEPDAESEAGPEPIPDRRPTGIAASERAASDRPAPSGSSERAAATGATMSAARANGVEDEERAGLVAAPAEAEVAVDPRALETLRRDFGHAALRPGQAAVIANVLARRDTLATMPTGAGKSLTFQLPAMLLEGTTLVISPLIALMKDQVESLPEAVRARTTLLNSTLSSEEQRRVLDRLADGAYKLVYAAPERLRQHAFLRALRTSGTALVVVDEAHCISMWGHDFRPDYLTIPTALPELGDPPVLAMTATATPRIAAGIGAAFGRTLDRVRGSLFRANLFYEVHRVANREEKVVKTLEICRRERGAGIVYVSSRKDAEQIAGNLRDRGVDAIPYHAGLEPETRARNQERFMGGATRVVVATVAFGMGVNKADVRFIVHLNPPPSLEAYAQESGRAGRDGKPARCVLLTAPADQANLNRLARRDELDLDTIRRVYAGVKRAAAGGRWATVEPSTLLPPPEEDVDWTEGADPRIALGLLDQADLVRRHADAPITFAIRPAPEAGDEAPAADEFDDALWARFAAWAGWEEAGRAGVTIRTAAACDALGVTPVELARLFAGRPGMLVREGARLVCLELRPVGQDAGARLAEILSRAQAEARQRIAQVIAYAAGGRCRHVVLANHLGEALPPCGTVCDVCTGTVPAARRGRTAGAVGDATDNAAPARTATTAADARAVLEAVRTLAFPMGKTGLTKLLLGSVESRLRADRSPSFGALSALKKGKVDGLIDRLVEDGFLHRDLAHEYKLITLTRQGVEATVEDLAAYEGRPRAAGGATPREGGGADDEVALSDDDLALLDRLVDWRRERASRDGMPSYVIAHNATLRAIALARPTSLADLGTVHGFGPARVEKYGDEVLAIVAGG